MLFPAFPAAGPEWTFQCVGPGVGPWAVPLGLSQPRSQGAPTGTLIVQFGPRGEPLQSTGGQLHSARSDHCGKVWQQLLGSCPSGPRGFPVTVCLYWPAVLQEGDFRVESQPQRKAGTKNSAKALPGQWSACPCPSCAAGTSCPGVAALV